MGFCQEDATCVPWGMGLVGWEAGSWPCTLGSVPGALPPGKADVPAVCPLPFSVLDTGHRCPPPELPRAAERCCKDSHRACGTPDPSWKGPPAFPSCALTGEVTPPPGGSEWAVQVQGAARDFCQVCLPLGPSSTSPHFLLHPLHQPRRGHLVSPVRAAEA